MSAFVVSDDHIDGLLTWAIRKMPFHYWGGHKSCDITPFNASEVGRILLAANIKSVNARYKANDDETTEYEFNAFSHTAELPLVAILKACDCFDYQSCEVDDYETSVAHTIIDAIRSRAIRLLPGYSEGNGWELKRSYTHSRSVYATA